MKKVGFVVDSTCDLSPEFYQEKKVTMVPLIVRFNEETFRDHVDITPEEFYRKLKESSVIPKTSQPSVQEFVEAYQEIADKYEIIVSIHISSKLSGTFESASIASKNVNADLRIIDTGNTTTSMAAILKLALRKQNEGVDGEDLVSYVKDLVERVRIFGMLDSLDYLVKGGRIGRAQGFVGSVLNFKPLLTVKEGVVAPLGRARGNRNAMKMLLEEIKNISESEGEIYIHFGYSDNPSLVEEFKNYLKSEGVSYVDLGTLQVGAVIGTYLGFGVMLFSVIKI